MFGQVQPTRYDLQFSLFGIPVRVIPWFWVTGVVFQFDLLRDRENGPLLLMMWLAILFVSILVHELGHATVARMFGFSPSIILYHFGGLAVFEPLQGYTTARSILISLAGPGFGFVLGGLVYVVREVIPPEHLTYLGFVAVSMLIWVNIGWGLINLLPVLPLDGGHICRDIAVSVNRHRGVEVAMWISVVVGGAIAAWFFSQHQTYRGILFAALAVQNYMELQQRRTWY